MSVEIKINKLWDWGEKHDKNDIFIVAFVY